MSLSGRPHFESFKISLPALLGLLFVFGSLAPPLLVHGKGSTPIPCHDFFFKVSTRSFNDTGFIEPAASYNISATYCPPTKFVLHRATTVQLLVHGGGLDKLYWSALAPVGSADQIQPHNYSHVDFARGQGYHTIAIDRLGTGNSTLPDPLVVRARLEAEQIHIIIQQIRRRIFSLLPLPEKIVLIGHSYGSFIISIMLDEYPKAADAIIMTGFAHVFSSAASSVGQQQIAPARDVFPSKWGNLDPGYLALANQTNQRENFYAADGTFDPEVSRIQYSREEIQAVGEVNSITDVLASSYTTDTSLYRGPLAFMTGQNDQVFCHGDCGTGNSSLIALSQPFYPHVSRYTGFLIPDTGHLLQYHYSARKGFELLHEWLATGDF